MALEERALEHDIFSHNWSNLLEHNKCLFSLWEETRVRSEYNVHWSKYTVFIDVMFSDHECEKIKTRVQELYCNPDSLF